MSWVVIIALSAALITALIAALLYWLLVVAEGAYLGRRVVVFLYDRFASRYDAVKQYDASSDAFHLAAPILAHDRAGRVLDVATGTGRLAASLISIRSFHGSIDAVDASAAMLRIAQPKFAATDRVRLHRADAANLPFAADAYACVTCLEALEFMPDRRAVIAELLRVLRPGGLLIVSNRIGPDAWKLPGRAVTSAHLAHELAALGAPGARRRDWLVDYDLLMAQKSEKTSAPASDAAVHLRAGASAPH
jgi:SAM-dependent methyltransferase